MSTGRGACITAYRGSTCIFEEACFSVKLNFTAWAPVHPPASLQGGFCSFFTQQACPAARAEQWQTTMKLAANTVNISNAFHCMVLNNDIGQR